MKYFVFVFIASTLTGATMHGQATTSEAQTGIFTIERDYPQSNIDGYNLYIPSQYTDDGKKWPVLMFLQGGKAVGGEVGVVLHWGLPGKLANGADDDSELAGLIHETFIVIMPHIRRGQFYENVEAIHSILGEVGSGYNIDLDRIYLTGLSRGGHGTWGLASLMPETFAAIAPVCGAPHGVDDYADLRDIPIWTSHNTDDGIVNSVQTDQAVGRIEKLSRSKFHRTRQVAGTDYESHRRIYTARVSDSHDAWTEMYSEPVFFKWLLRHGKSDRRSP